MKKWLKITSISVGSLGLVGAGAGAVLGIVLPKALEAKSALANFISKGGSRVNLRAQYEKKGKLKVVAIGDSITAGYNGILGSIAPKSDINKKLYTPGEKYSYVDFLVKSLRTGLGGEEKIEYKNFAKTGLRLADIKMVLESPEVTKEFRDADIVPISIGANDILALLKLFHLPFWLGVGLLSQSSDLMGKIGTTKDFIRKDEETEGLFNKIIKSATEGSVPKGNQIRERDQSNITFSGESSDLMSEKTINDLEAIADGDVGKYLTIDVIWKQKIFDLIKREVATLIRDIHNMAPHAQIIVLGHDFPFAQFPPDVLYGKISNMNNHSLLQVFNNLLNAMRDGAKSSLGKNDFVDFYKADELQYMKPYSWKLSNFDKKPVHGPKYKSVFSNYDQTDEATFINNFHNNPMPNITDIHPSIFGHSLIGKSLFNIYGRELGLSEEQMQRGLDVTQTREFKDKGLFEKTDEDPAAIAINYNSSKDFYTLLSKWKDIPNNLLEALDKTIREFKINKSGAGEYKKGEYAKSFAKYLENKLLAMDGIILQIAKETAEENDFSVQIVSSIVKDKLKEIQEPKNKDLLNKILSEIQRYDADSIAASAANYKMSLEVLEDKNLDEKQRFEWNLIKVASFFDFSKKVATALNNAKSVVMKQWFPNGFKL